MAFRCARCNGYTHDPERHYIDQGKCYGHICEACNRVLNPVAAPSPKAIDPATIALIMSLVSLILQWFLERKTGALRRLLLPRRSSARLAKLETKTGKVEAWKAKQDRDQRALGSSTPDLEELRQILDS